MRVLIWKVIFFSVSRLISFVSSKCHQYSFFGSLWIHTCHGTFLGPFLLVASSTGAGSSVKPYACPQAGEHQRRREGPSRVLANRYLRARHGASTEKGEQTGSGYRPVGSPHYAARSLGDPHRQVRQPVPSSALFAVDESHGGASPFCALWTAVWWWSRAFVSRGGSFPPIAA